MHCVHLNHEFGCLICCFRVDLHVFPQHNHVHDSGITQMYSYIYNLHNDFRIDGTQLSVTKNIVMHHLRYNSTVIAA